jgi:hypothetical protein
MHASTDRDHDGTRGPTARTRRLVRLCHLLARCCPAALVPDDSLPEPGDDLRRALRFCGVVHTPPGTTSLAATTVVRAGFGAGLLALLCGTLLAVPVVVAAPDTRLAVAPALLALALGTVHAVHRGPVLLARVRRTRALGRVTGLLGRTVLRMRIEPSPERAARFAARTADDALAASLGAHVRRRTGRPGSGLGTFADEWADWFPALSRSVALVTAAADAPAGERGRTLDRALSAVLDGTRDRLTAFAGQIRGPATGLYAFGVLLPLALLGVVPAARVAGVGVGIVHLVAVYDVLLPLGLVCVAGWLLSRRPVAFPPPTVGRDHPDVPDDARRALLAGVASAVVGSVLAAVLVDDWAAPLAAVGLGVGVACHLASRPVRAVRDHARAVESGLDDALYLVGRRVLEGEAMETALERAGAELDGETGAVLADAARRGRTLDLGVRDAFLGDHGALADVPSPRTRGTAALLVLAATEGRPAGDAVVALADHLSDLARVEAEARRQLRQVTDTLASTASVFGPLVAGATVALADGIRAAGQSNGGPGLGPAPASGGSVGSSAALATGDLGLAVGAYTLLLAAVLTALAVGLEHGLDRAVVGYRVGAALCSATVTFLLAVVGAGLLV